jgi:hypothetical protein
MWSWNPRAVVVAALTLLAAGCQPRTPEPAASTEAAPPDTVAQPATDQSLSLVIARNAEKLMGIPGVVGVYEGVTGGKPVLRVMVSSRADSTLERIPKTLEGYDVEVEVSGAIRPMNH